MTRIRYSKDENGNLVSKNIETAVGSLSILITPDFVVHVMNSYGSAHLFREAAKNSSKAKSLAKNWLISNGAMFVGEKRPRV